MRVGEEQQIEFLTARGAATTPHSRTTLLAHLGGTRDLLARWGNDPDTCAAGLYHSVYGTYVFSHAVVSAGERDAVRAVIGERAEALAWLFGSTDRRSFFDAQEPEGAALRPATPGGTITHVDSDTLARLIEIEVADTVEQLPRRKPRRQREYAWYRDAFECNLERLSAGAIEAFRRAFAEARAAQSTQERTASEPGGI